MITTDYFRTYRSKLGFTNQNDAKNFLGAKDLKPSIDIIYLDQLNKRLFDIAKKVNGAVSSESQLLKLNDFKNKIILKSYKTIMDNNILPLLNNQGRRPEEVYYSWMRGFVALNFFQKSLGIVFGVDCEKFTTIGEDDLKHIDTFKRAPTADLEVNFNGKMIRLEIQSGFTGTNDIKQHKVLEARKIFREKSISTLCVHFDIYNGQTAFVILDQIQDDNVNWITRQQMEGQTVFSIDQNYFVWKLTEKPLSIKRYLKELN